MLFYAECLIYKILQVLPAVEPDTSFVIAAKDGTDKILMARRFPGCSVVKISWLMQCLWSITRADPKPHVMAATGEDTSLPVPAIRAQNIPNGALASSPVSSKEASVDDEDDSDEDDDLAAEFEKELM